MIEMKLHLELFDEQKGTDNIYAYEYKLKTPVKKPLYQDCYLRGANCSIRSS